METFLREQLSDYTFFGVGRIDGKHRGEMCGVFFKTARFEMLDGGHFWLSTTPEKPGSRGWGAISPHMVTWVKLRPLDGGPTFCWFNTHFDAFSGRGAHESRPEAAARSHESRSPAPCPASSPATSTPAPPPRPTARCWPSSHRRRRRCTTFSASPIQSLRARKGRSISSPAGRRTAHRLDSRQLAFPDHRCRHRPHPRTARLPLGSLSGDRDAPSPSHHRTVTADLAHAVARSIRTCNPSATPMRDRPPRRSLPVQQGHFVFSRGGIFQVSSTIFARRCRARP